MSGIDDSEMLDNIKFCINLAYINRKKRTYSEQDGKRQDSFNKAIKHIARVVRSEVWCLMAVSITSTVSDSVTCEKHQRCKNCNYIGNDNGQKQKASLN